MYSRGLHNTWSSTLSLNAMPTTHSFANHQYGNFRRSKSVRNLSLYDDEPEAAGQRQLRRIVLRRPTDLSVGLGFSIRGGRELGLGIFVSKVVERSVADRAGLVPGDQILAVNDTSFEDIGHEEAIKVLKSASRLNLLVCSTGRVPGSCVVHQTYTWLDSEGRTVSPPPEYDHSFYSSPAHRKAVSRLHTTPRIRKVTIRVEKGQSLGLMIRGGVEYGLGIYITGVDKASVADMANLKVGDQILEVNSQSFLDITHDEAVRVLKYSAHMIMTIREVGKVPYSCTTYDESQWVGGSRESVPADTRAPSRMMRKSDFNLTRGSLRDPLEHTIDIQALRILNEKAKLVLSKHELATLNYYRIEYERGQMTIDSFVAVLLELLETEEKYALLQDIREVIHPMDLHKFDELIYKKDLDMARTRQRLGADDRSSRNRFSSVSMDHLTSHVATSHSPRQPRRTDPHATTRFGVSQSSDGSDGLPDMSPSEGTRSVGRPLSRTGRRRGTYLSAPGDMASDPYDEDVHTPSEDSGVDLANGSYYTSLNQGSNRLGMSSKEVLESRNQWRSGPYSHSLDRTVDRSSDRSTYRHQDDTRRLAGDRYYGSSSRRHSGGGGGGGEPALDNLPHRRHYSTDRRWSIGSDKTEPVPAYTSEDPSLTSFYDDTLLPNGLNSSLETPILNDLPPEHSSVIRVQDGLLTLDLGPSSAEKPIDEPSQDDTRASKKRMVQFQPPQEASVCIRDGQGNILVTMKKIKPYLGIAIEGGADTQQPLPRIINIQRSGAAFEAGGIQVGHIIVAVNGHSLEGMDHQAAANLIATAYADNSRSEIEFLVKEAKWSPYRDALKSTAMFIMED